MNKLFYHPTNDSAGEGAAQSNDNENVKSYIPSKKADIEAVGAEVNKNWKENPWLTLQYTSQSVFEKQVETYSQSVEKAGKAAGKISSNSSDLKSLDKQIDVATGETGLRADLKKKFKSNINAQYGRYGFERKSNGYVLPKDRDKRLLAIKRIPDALVEDGLANVEYGEKFWRQMIDEYDKALGNQNKTIEVLSGETGSKDEVKKQIVKTMRSILFVLRGNFIDNPTAAYRKWGFKKIG